MPILRIAHRGVVEDFLETTQQRLVCDDLMTTQAPYIPVCETRCYGK